MDWARVFASQPLLPCVREASSGVPDAVWVTTQDSHVYLWHSRNLLCCNNAPQPLPGGASSVQRLLAAAAAHGVPLHVVSPDPVGCTAAELADSLQFLETSLVLRSLAGVTVQHLVDAVGVVVDPLTAAGSLLAAAGRAGERMVMWRTAGGRVPRNARLRMDVAAQLTAAMPAVLQWLAAWQPEQLFQRPPPPPPPTGQQGPPQGQGLVARVGAALGHVLIMAVPGLQDKLELLSTNLTTEVS